jgi:hypothetical protein
MNKPVGRTVVSIMKFDPSTQQIEHEHIEIYDKSPLRGLARKYVPKAGDRIFIYPDSNIPRFKLKRFCETYKVSVAKVKETANVFFMDPKSANTDDNFYEVDTSGYLMSKEYFTNYVKKSTRIGDKRYIKLLADLEASTETVVYLYEYYNLRDKGLNKYKLDIVDKDDLEEDDDGHVDLTLVNCESEKIHYVRTEDQKKSFDFLEGKDFYHPDAMLALLNEGSVLDKEMYDGIMNLFQSKDMNDHKVAMEAMANCDYQKSAVYLLMTFYHNQNKIYNCDTRTHVNFKSYLNFFKLAASNSIQIDDIVDKLKDKKLLDSSNLAIVMKEAKKVMKETVESNTEYFIFSEIEPTEEIKKEVEETDAEIAAALVVIPEPVIVPVVEPTPEPVVELVTEKEPEDAGGLSHL